VCVCDSVSWNSDIRRKLHDIQARVLVSLKHIESHFRSDESYGVTRNTWKIRTICILVCVTPSSTHAVAGVKLWQSLKVPHKHLFIT
jgi:hypothetical protein